MPCNGFVPVVLLTISLTILRFILSQITFKKNNTNMEQIKNSNTKTIIMNGIKSMIETVWTIGASITGAIALKFNF